MCYLFNMTDVLRASVQADRLDALYRAGMAPLAVFAEDDVDAASKFWRTYLKRDPACMSCHTTTYSTTDPIKRNDDWDRFVPVGAGQRDAELVTAEAASEPVLAECVPDPAPDRGDQGSMVVCRAAGGVRSRLRVRAGRRACRSAGRRSGDSGAG